MRRATVRRRVRRRAAEPRLARWRRQMGSSTVAVWTQNYFFPLLLRPQGSQGCKKFKKNFGLQCGVRRHHKPFRRGTQASALVASDGQQHTA